MNPITEGRVWWIGRAKQKVFSYQLLLELAWSTLKRRRVIFSYFWDDLQKSELEKVRTLFNTYDLSISLAEAFQIYSLAQATQKIEGDIAEVGVYKGGSAKVICLGRDDNKVLHLCDTFKGMPAVSEKDEGKFKEGGFVITEDEFDAIRRRFADERHIEFHRGIFPGPAGSMRDRTFSFVHLDADIYESTKDSLEFFYPRVNRGGVILTHDYFGAPGVRKAFTEFFADKPEMVIQLSTSQAFVVKL